MTIDMQRLLLKEIMDVLKNYSRIVNDDRDPLNSDCCGRIKKAHAILVDEDDF